MNEITFESDGYTLAGNLFINEQKSSDNAYLFIQGWAGSQNIEAAQALTNLGSTTMTYDMRGNKDSEGDLAEFSRSDFIKDAGAAYDYLRQKVGEKAYISVVGSSFGSYTAAILSTERDAYSLSLRVPANYPDEGYDEPQLAQITPETIEWRKQVLDFTQTKSLRALHDFNGKIQIIEAEADEAIPSQTSKNYGHAVSNRSLLSYEVMPNAPHRLLTPELREDYIARLIAWIQT